MRRLIQLLLGLVLVAGLLAGDPTPAAADDYDCKGRTDKDAGFNVGCGGGSGGGGGGSSPVSWPDCSSIFHFGEVGASKDEAYNDAYIYFRDRLAGEEDPAEQINKYLVKRRCNPDGEDHVWVFVEPGKAPDNPEWLAQSLFASMELDPVVIGHTPLDETAPVIVGQPVWLWVENRTRQAFGEWTETDSVGGAHLTLTAKVASVTFDFNDGSHPQTCTRDYLDREWSLDDPRADEASPECGHKFLITKRDLTVQVTAHWEAKWSASGSGWSASGTLKCDYPTTFSVDVAELQVVNVYPE
jgi:hypothetical protein